MNISTTLIIVILLTLASVSYVLGRKKAVRIAGGKAGIKNLHSLPAHYGTLTALWCGIPALLVFSCWLAFQDTVITSLVVSDLPEQFGSYPEDRLNLVVNDIKNLVSGNIISGDVNMTMIKAADHYRDLMATSKAALVVLVLVVAIMGALAILKLIKPQTRARNKVERFVKILLVFCSTIAIFTTIGIVLAVLYEAIRFFKVVPIHEFLFGLDWSPQMAIRDDQVGSSGAFGAIPVLAGTMMISVIAMFIAVPIGLMAAIYLSEYAGKKARATVKPLMEILAGIPTVVYGFFAALTVAPFIRNSGSLLGLDVSSESALAAGLVMGIMIIPFVSSLSDDVINAVPQTLRDGAYSLGATQSETIRQIIVPAALPGIVGSILLAVSRAIGETMIVVMAAGLSANLTANPLKAVTTVTVLFNVVALKVVRKYREQYE